MSHISFIVSSLTYVLFDVAVYVPSVSHVPVAATMGHIPLARGRMSNAVITGTVSGAAAAACVITGAIIGCPTSSVTQVNLTIKINFKILRSFRSSDILTIYLHAFLQSLHQFEENCVQGLPRDFRQNNLNTNKKFRWSFSTISHQLSFDVAKRKKSGGAKSGE
jgi:hypothetical protein